MMDGPFNGSRFISGIDTERAVTLLRYTPPPPPLIPPVVTPVMASHSQGSPSPPPPLDTALLPAKRKIACLACRTIKLRCLFAGPDAAPLDPCRRCKRLDIACIYQPKRRPVKPSSTAQASSATTNSADTGKLVVVDGGGEDDLLQSRRTRSPFDAVDSIHHPYTQQMYPQQQQQSGQPRMSYGVNQSDGYPEHPSKRRRIPGPGQPGEGYGEFESSFTGPAAGERADAYGYEGYGVYGGSLGRQVVPHFPAGHSGADRPGTGASESTSSSYARLMLRRLVPS